MIIILSSFFAYQPLILVQICINGHIAKEILQPILTGPAVDAMHACQPCWTHNKNEHDIFINYRVATEGKKAENSVIASNFCLS